MGLNAIYFQQPVCYLQSSKYCCWWEDFSLSQHVSYYVFILHPWVPLYYCLQPNHHTHLMGIGVSLPGQFFSKFQQVFL